MSAGRILLVEDNPLEARLARRVLESPESGYSVLEAPSLRDARNVSPNDFDAILLDLILPDSSGLETVRQIVAHFPNKPVVVMSGRDEADVAEQTLEEGAQDYLVKGKTEWSMVLRSLRYAIVRHQSLEEVRRREAVTRELIDRNAGGILVLDPQGLILFANPAAAELMGSDAAALTGQSFGFPAFSGGASQIEILRGAAEPLMVEMRVNTIDWKGTRAFLVSLREVYVGAAQSAARASSSAMLQRLADASLAVQTSRSLEDVLGVAAAGACELVNGTSAIIALNAVGFDHHQEGVYPAAISAAELGALRLFFQSLRSAGRSSLGAEPGRIAVPVATADRSLHGFLIVNLRPGAVLTISELRALRQFSQVASVAIQNLSLVGQLEEAGLRLHTENEHLAALSAVSTEVLATLNPRGWIAASVARLREALGASACAVLITSPDAPLSGVVCSSQNVGRDLPAIEVDFEFLDLPPDSSDPEAFHGPHGWLEPVFGSPLSSILLCRLLQDGICLGYLCAGWADTYDANDRERQLFKAVAVRCALVIHAAILDQRREQALVSLRRAIDLLDAMFTSAPVAIFAIDAAGLVTSWNPAAERIFGWPPEDVIGKPAPFEYCAQGAPFTDLIAQARAGELLTGIECALPRHDGVLVEVGISAALLAAARETDPGVIIIMQDIGHGKEVERALRRSQQRLARAHRMASLGDWETDYASGATDWSDEVFEILGLDRDATTPSPAHLLELIDPSHRDQVEAARARTLASGQPYDLEYSIVRPDKAERSIREHGEVRFDHRGGVLALAGTVQDVTAFKHLQQEFLQAQKMESIGRLAGGVAHDFNNHLTVINGYCDLLLARRSLDEFTADRVSQIRKAGERAAALTRQLLTFSRKQASRPRLISLNETIVEIEPMLLRLVGEDIELETNLDPELGHALADPGQISQVLMNLVVNARDAMPNGGRVIVSTANDVLGGFVCLTVRDFGSGMTEEVRRRIFEPFFTTKLNGSGTGLGLSTVYGIVTQAGGRVEVQTEPGRGSEFRIFLPVHLGDDKPEPPTLIRPHRLDGSETILLVEDQTEVRRLAAEVLQSFGYRVISAGDSEEALRILNAREPIDLMLTDVVMPGRKGPELATLAREVCPGIRVAFMSAHPDEVVARHAPPTSSFSYLRKPFSPEELAAHVRSVLDVADSRRTILIIDDEPAIRNLICEFLSTGEYRILEAPDGDEALRIVSETRVDLIVSDSVLPGIESILRISEEYPDIRIIAMSGATGPMFERVARSLGALATLSKPIQFETLLTEIEKVLALPPKARRQAASE